MGRRWLAAALAFAPLPFGAAACGDAQTSGPESEAGASDASLDAPEGAALDVTSPPADALDAPPLVDAAIDAAIDASFDAACATTITAYPVVASPHVAVCSAVTYTSNPPTSGPHYPVWAAYRAYTAPVPRGFYVHDLEHGAVVVLYDCPTGCTQDVDAVRAYLDARAADPLCTPPVKNRFVIAPDPDIPTRFAAVAWGYALTSNCFDLAALETFIDDHYAKSPENECADGVDVTATDGGIPADCGQ